MILFCFVFILVRMNLKNVRMQQNVHRLIIVHMEIQFQHQHVLIKNVHLVLVNSKLNFHYSYNLFSIKLKIYVNIRMILKMLKMIGNMLKMYVKHLGFIIVFNYLNLDAKLYS